MPHKPTKTAGRIKNINAYINKVGAFFGINSPEYQNITNQLANAGLVTYENKKGYVNISNSKINRMKHQSIRAIDKRKPSFARQKKRFLKEQKELFPDLEIPDIGGDFGDGVNIEFDESTGFDPKYTTGAGGKPLDFDTWYKEWRNTWVLEEQYEIRQLADDLGVPFDHDQWYQDYAYREQIITELYNAYEQGIETELESARNANGDTINTETGEPMTFDSEWYNEFTDIEW